MDERAYDALSHAGTPFAPASRYDPGMRYRRLGNTDLVVSEVGLGTWTLVSDWWGQSEDPAAIIAAALDAGITFIDTAPVYGR